MTAFENPLRIAVFEIEAYGSQDAFVGLHESYVYLVLIMNCAIAIFTANFRSFNSENVDFRLVPFETCSRHLYPRNTVHIEGSRLKRGEETLL
ncbi:UNVERIFIED_CONTAM: hypothetical protein NCL1_40543 [Trichonephila clavipes]